MNIQPNETYMLDLLTKLLNTPSPSGFTHRIMKVIEAEAKALGFAVTQNEKGGAIITMKGKDSSRLCPQRACRHFGSNGSFYYLPGNAGHHLHRRVHDAEH